jgi:ADP-ribose pyrophosphatase
VSGHTFVRPGVVRAGLPAADACMQCGESFAMHALRAVHEALDIPHAATVGDGEVRDKILAERMLDAVVFLSDILTDGRHPLGAEWALGYFREKLAEHPAEGYHTWNQAVAELAAETGDAGTVLAPHATPRGLTPCDAMGPDEAPFICTAVAGHEGVHIAYGRHSEVRFTWPQDTGSRTYTHPDVFAAGVAEGWAEAETDPTRIDWPARQAAAAIPFEVTGGRPVNPCEKTAVRHGRNEMGYWGETLMADALVTVSLPPFGSRYLLMVRRGDGYGWAVPGGHVDPGESGLAAAVRELAEETGLVVSPGACHGMQPRYVPDPRASDEAWAVTVPVRIDLGTRDALPEVSAGDDAALAEWIPADTYGHLTDALQDRHGGGEVFAAHAGMLREFLAAGGAR